MKLDTIIVEKIEVITNNLCLDINLCFPLTRAYIIDIPIKFRIISSISNTPVLLINCSISINITKATSIAKHFLNFLRLNIALEKIVILNNIIKYITKIIIYEILFILLRSSSVS